MRIVNREEFLKLPSGTLYAVYNGFETDCREELFIKWDTISEGVDFIFQPLIDIDSHDTEHDNQLVKNLELGEEVKASFDSTQRDANYNPKTRYIVYTSEEVRALHALIGRLINPSTPVTVG